ncbi:MAG: sigma-70 family RNA polymerase sigma factor [Acidobacteriota bacterium]|nr:sigma-70 family RNA polymerase sigma factor [Acidobacteriota bacterium]
MSFNSALSNALAGEALPLAAGHVPVCADMDNESFAGFYERSARPLWSYIARVSGDPTLADDLMQESFVRFLTAAPPNDGEVAARRYLFRIATNLLRDHWRKPRTTPLDEVPEERFAAADATPVHSELSPVLALLRPRDRQLLWLAYAEGYSHREIADVTGLASASIRLLLFRARRKMAQMLREGTASTAQAAAHSEVRP